MNKVVLAGIATVAVAVAVLLALSAGSDLLVTDPPTTDSFEVMLPDVPAPDNPIDVLEKLVQPDDPSPDPFTYDPKAAAECERAGGDYFLAEIYVCQMPVGDEGKACTDSSQCEDICSPDPDIYGYEDLEGESDIQGRCTVFSHGCDQVLVDGRAQWLCG